MALIPKRDPEEAELETRPTCVRLPKALKRRLERIVKETGRDVSDVLRLMIAHGCEQYEKEAAEAKTKR